ncbi:hypothetical protein B0J13DRAFT_29715 [Dactylonectria estremocensis]|uniref:Uncharacterized protein n=1 Tax=Dactylonectria estremocensis TaxID=1079267 RepID=A0A9P9FKF1_9HYPO|nr:hypothetical protein B0J13DRAFT_29715 [Dactylonectria estremocensis]
MQCTRVRISRTGVWRGVVDELWNTALTRQNRLTILRAEVTIRPRSSDSDCDCDITNGSERGQKVTNGGEWRFNPGKGGLGSARRENAIEGVVGINSRGFGDGATVRFRLVGGLAALVWADLLVGGLADWWISGGSGGSRGTGLVGGPKRQGLCMGNCVGASFFWCRQRGCRRGGKRVRDSAR